MEQKNNTQVPPPAPQISQSAFHIPPTNEQFITTKLRNKFEKLKKSNKKITDELFFELATHLRFHYDALLQHPYIKHNQRLINKIIKKSSETNIQENIYRLLKNHSKQPTTFDFPITDIYRFSNYIRNLMNKQYLPSETVETDGEDYLETMLNEISKQEQEREAQEDQERHNQSPTQEEEDAGLQWRMDGGKKKSKTRRKRKKRKTKKRRKNKRKTKKRRKTKRRKTKRRKK